MPPLPPLYPKCSRCDDNGLVTLDQTIADQSMIDGFRKTPVAYRCECSAGAAMSKRFPLAPPAEDVGRLPIPGPPARRDLDD
jgi:hypothetical protein